jgi:hypothetical protein
MARSSRPYLKATFNGDLIKVAIVGTPLSHKLERDSITLWRHMESENMNLMVEDMLCENFPGWVSAERFSAHKRRMEEDNGSG